MLIPKRAMPISRRKEADTGGRPQGYEAAPSAALDDFVEALAQLLAADHFRTRAVELSGEPATVHPRGESHER